MARPWSSASRADFACAFRAMAAAAPTARRKGLWTVGCSAKPGLRVNGTRNSRRNAGIAVVDTQPAGHLKRRADGAVQRERTGKAWPSKVSLIRFHDRRMSYPAYLHRRRCSRWFARHRHATIAALWAVSHRDGRAWCSSASERTRIGSRFVRKAGKSDAAMTAFCTNPQRMQNRRRVGGPDSSGNMKHSRPRRRSSALDDAATPSRQYEHGRASLRHPQ